MNNVVPMSAQDNNSSTTCGQASADSVTFDDFWAIYPRRQAKVDARKAWAKIKPEEHVAILQGIMDWMPAWREKEFEYCPMPATYLNGGRWEDEVPPRFRRATSSSHVPAAPSAPLPARTGIPPHIAAILAKVRRGERL